MDAAKVLKEDTDDPSEANSCSGGITTDEDCSNAAARGTSSLPNDALPVSHRSSASPDGAVQHLATPGGVEKDDMRSESIASLRAKAQNYSAYMHGLQRHRQQLQQQQQGQRDIADDIHSRHQRQREQFEYSILYGGSRSEMATLGDDVTITDDIRMADTLSVTSDDDDDVRSVVDDDAVKARMRTANRGGSGVDARRVLGSVDVVRDSFHHLQTSSARI